MIVMSSEKQKGVINVIELVIVLSLLLVSFNVFFPGQKYEDNWEDAYGIISSRDSLLVLERTGNLHSYAFDSDSMENFIDELFPNTNLIVWSEVTGGIKSEVKIACDDQSVASEMNDWANGLRLNERNITVTFCYTDMTSTDSCLLTSDSMLIWGYKDLSDYEDVLTDYVSEGNGIVEVMDIEALDDVQTSIFGLNFIGSINVVGNPTSFSRTPLDPSDPIYGPRKYFYGIPMPLDARDNCDFDGCVNPKNEGYLEFGGTSYGFCVCDDGVWFDVDGGSDYTDSVTEQSTINIGGYTFYLNYINSESKISVSFRPDYDFENINLKTSLQPDDGSNDRVIIDTVSGTTYPVIILNEVGSSRLVWSAPFEDGISNYEDDDKSMLLSLLLWSINKESSGEELLDMRVGYRTTYIKTFNRDMFEIYSFNLGVGYPF